MDSVSQLALGAAIGVAVMGRRTAVWKAALWGGIAGTLPDLDAFIDYGDPVSNMTFHRGHSHGLFWLTLGAPVLAWIASRVHREPQAEPGLFRRWWLALWLALVTHPLLDTLTVYGTQLLQPFSERPFAVGSIFIIDPLYTLPLLLGLVIALTRHRAGGLRWNQLGLVLSTAYLGWSVLAQSHVREIALASLAAQGQPAEQVLVTPTLFNTVLWRVLAMEENNYREGYYSLLDPEPTIRFRRFERDAALARELQHLWPVRRMAWFSRGFYRVHEANGAAVITDLRMGQEPSYVFAFRVARRASAWAPVPPEHVGFRGDPSAWLRWTWQRMHQADIAPPDVRSP